MFFELISNLKKKHTDTHAQTHTNVVLQRPGLKVGPREGGHAAKASRSNTPARRVTRKFSSPVVSAVGEKEKKKVCPVMSKTKKNNNKKQLLCHV